MEDLTIKVESLFGIQKAIADQQGINIHPAAFISDLAHFLPKIMCFFTQLAGHMKTIIDDSDDDGMENCTQQFTEEMKYIKICFGLCLRLLSGLFTWTGFEEQDHHELLCG